jgi:erythromycin esterase
VPGDRKPGESCAEAQEQSAGVANRDRGPTSHLRQHTSQKALIRLHMNRAGTGTVAILGSALSLLICVEAAALNPFVVWARKAAIHVKGTDPEQSLDDLQPVRKIIGHARLVAAGESRHDLHEQIQFKLRLIQFLVQQMNFSGIAMEVSMPDAARVDDYVFRGSGDARRLVHDRLGYWDAWDTEEILAIIQWLRQYNADPAHGPRVHFYGFDMMFPSSSVEEVLQFLEEVESSQAAKFREQTARVRKEPEKLSREEWVSLQSALSDLKSDFDAHRQEYSSRSSTAALEWALQQVAVSAQYARWWLAPADGVSNRADVRERSMAQNVQWILQKEGPGGRVFVSAHNAHVAKGFRRRPEGAGYGSPLSPMGRYLNEVLGASMMVFAATFNQGKLQATGPFKDYTFDPALGDSLDGQLSHASNAVLRLGSAIRSQHRPAGHSKGMENPGERGVRPRQ